MHKNGEEKMSQVISDVKEKGRSLLSEGLEHAKEIFEEQKVALKEKADQFGEKTVVEVAKDVQNFIKRNPWKSVAMAVGAGVLLSLIFRSSSEE